MVWPCFVQIAPGQSGNTYISALSQNVRWYEYICKIKSEVRAKDAKKVRIRFKVGDMGFICRKVGLVAIGMAGMKNVILSFSKGLMDGKHAGSKADS